MRTDGNKVALIAARNVLDGAKPFDVDIAGKLVSCSVSRVAERWPEGGIRGLDEQKDGPAWPSSVMVECTWEGGRCTLRVGARWVRARGRYRHQVGLHVKVKETGRVIVWTNLVAAMADAADGTNVKVEVAVSTFKRKDDDQADLAERLNRALRELVAESGLPLVTAANAEAHEIELPSGAIHPSAEVAFRRLVQLALLKIEFVDRGKQAKARGTPLVDLRRWGVSAEQLEGLTEDAEDDVDEPPSPPSARRYWCGGFGEAARLTQFLNENSWQISWPRDAKERPARRTWRRFADVRVGDRFAIKGYGGRNDLVIHYVGEVTSVDQESGRLGLQRIDVPLFKGKAPGGRRGGAWFDTLVPVTRADVIESIFGVKSRDAAPLDDSAHDDPRLNLIFYGPPGTGKTYKMRELQRGFLRRVEGSARQTTESAASLKWYQVIALAIHAAKGSATVDQIIEHPLVLAKYAAQAIPTPLRQIVWGTLGQHAIEASKTVKMKRRFGELLFDKKEDGSWFLAEKLPDDLATLSDELRGRAMTTVMQDFSFVTFHQSYAYEDFIEGIRPQVSGGDEESSLSYTLVDGAFKQAVRAALGLAGHKGTIDEFCRLSLEDRQRALENAPPYAIFIDEINRGNVARIFGELITLLEPDKRLGEDQELIVDLPHSRSKFGVPSNLYVFGTMNTADRSVEALDAALRRRFDFEELGPKPELLQDVEVDGGIRVDELLRVINLRVEKLYDRDHRIGHAYFLPLKDDDSLDNLKRIFRDRLLPLLQEYFFGDWGKIGLVLGKEFVTRRAAPAIEFAEFDHDDSDALMDRPSWELADATKLTNRSFRRIYEHVEDT